MWHVLVAGLAGGIPGILTSYLITGVLFQPFQRRTPGVWRAGVTPAGYAAAGVLKLLAGVSISLLVCLSFGIQDFSSPIMLGLVVGTAAWAAAAVPALLSVSIFVKLHPGFVAGLLIDWLVVCLLAGGISAWVQAP